MDFQELENQLSQYGNIQHCGYSGSTKNLVVIMDSVDVSNEVNIQEIIENLIVPEFPNKESYNFKSGVVKISYTI